MDSSSGRWNPGPLALTFAGLRPSGPENPVMVFRGLVVDGAINGREDPSDTRPIWHLHRRNAPRYAWSRYQMLDRYAHSFPLDPHRADFWIYEPMLGLIKASNAGGLVIAWAVWRPRRGVIWMSDEAQRGDIEQFIVGELEAGARIWWYWLAGKAGTPSPDSQKILDDLCERFPACREPAWVDAR